MTYPDSLRISEYMAKDTEMGRTKYPKYIMFAEQSRKLPIESNKAH